MKRTLLILAATLCCFVALAQSSETLKGVKVENLLMERVGDFINIDMELDISSLDVRTTQVAVLTPWIIKGGDSLSLRSVGVYGRNRYLYYQRNADIMPTNPDDMLYRESKMPSKVKYHSSVHFEEWMDGCRLAICRSDYGCCRKPLGEEADVLVHKFPLDPYIPELIYLRPEAESVKSRELSGSAFIDFPVSRTEIYPDYRNNPRELGKIIATIDSVKSDSDVTITSLSIKGYASPESPYENNTRLAKGRTEALKNYVEQMYHFGPGFIKTDYEPEDWVGLERYVEASTALGHKAEILAAIRSDREPDNKEWFIKSRWKADYKYLLENCYPALRHSDYKVEYTIRHYSQPEEIERIMHTAPQKLSLEEFYVLAQTYEPGSEELNELFEIAVRMYPHDPVANLNAANSAIIKGDYFRALKYLERAGDCPEAIYARGAMYLLQEDYDAARPYLEQAAELGLEQARQSLEGMHDHWKISLSNLK